MQRVIAQQATMTRANSVSPDKREPGHAHYLTEAEERAQEVYEHTNTVLSDPSSFTKVVSMVYHLLRGNKEGQDAVRMGDLMKYFNSITDESPSRPQVNQVFRAMDLNDDKMVTMDELQIFLRHILSEHRRVAEEKLVKAKSVDINRSKQQAAREVRERLKKGTIGLSIAPSAAQGMGRE